MVKTLGCTECRKRTDVDEICWFDGMAVCPECFDELVDTLEEKQKEEKSC